MVQINFAKRQINLKLVLWGPGMAGRTTFLEYVHRRPDLYGAGELTSIATEGDRTLFFDVVFPDLRFGGMQVKFQLYTVPGSVYYRATKKLVAQGADGLLFVADSQAERREENLEELELLVEVLGEQGFEPEKMLREKLVFLWNKRDLPSADSVASLNARLNRWEAPGVETVLAPYGVGALPALEELCTRVVRSLAEEFDFPVTGWPRVPPPPLVAGHFLIGRRAQRALADEHPALAEDGKWRAREFLVSRGGAPAEESASQPYRAAAGGAQPVELSAGEAAGLLEEVAGLLEGDGGALLPSLLARVEHEGRAALLVDHGEGRTTLRDRLDSTASRPTPLHDLWGVLLTALARAEEEGRLAYHGNLEPAHVAFSKEQLRDVRLQSPSPRRGAVFVTSRAYNPLLVQGPEADVLAVLAMAFESVAGEALFAGRMPPPEAHTDDGARRAWFEGLPAMPIEAPVWLRRLVVEGLRALLLGEGRHRFATPAAAVRTLSALRGEAAAGLGHVNPVEGVRGSSSPPAKGVWERIVSWFRD